jgi:hypothetical protein
MLDEKRAAVAELRKVIRGYAKDKNLNLILIGTIPVPHSKGKRSPTARQVKDIWSDKEQLSLRRKLFVSRLLQTD